ncbi:hypothetical protein [Tahibacter sp.]|uniref:hypothetical protein n=1 Tax=Tahibacter sp. TaxID=2056211 RepID=UPI0028C48828|nr:hypothetical protein [Tahibacter sp.]
MAEQELSLKALRLAALPEFDPPPNLWARIEAEHHRRQQRGRTLRWGSGLAAMLALATVVALAPRPQIAAANPLAQLERRSHELELAYAGLSQAASPLESEAELRAVELALQQAYDRGAAVDELLPLWQQRNDVLSNLIVLAADGAQPTRI